MGILLDQDGNPLLDQDGNPLLDQFGIDITVDNSEVQSVFSNVAIGVGSTGIVVANSTIHSEFSDPVVVGISGLIEINIEFTT